ncbi:MAG: ribosome biogenesis GTPase YlqF [Gammaproteobacteria bacterium]|nr:MAG: ribosome biogenesis GTPase YlqF [Gammaproteobacteria bacterium]
MSIHWYPGHMHKASKEMAKVLPQVDIIIELLDARIPYSSANPFIEKLREDKPSLKLISKSDLADPAITQLWQDYFDHHNQTKAFAIDNRQLDRSQRIFEACFNLAQHKANKEKTIVAMITGIPNVGKSTLINNLAGRHIAKTGNEPAVTKGQQRIKLENGITLLDTPGILWPKVENEHGSYRLAVTGAIRDTVVNYDDVAFYAAEHLITHYFSLLTERYKLASTTTDPLTLLEQIGRQRGCLRAGGQVDLERVSTVFINELRTGTIGSISLETPQMIEQELVEVANLQAAKEARKKAAKQRAAVRRKKPQKQSR